MKKLFVTILAAAALLCTACGDKQEVFEEIHASTTEVTPLPGSRFDAFTDHDAAFRLIDADDGTKTLAMERVKFVAEMPRISIEVRGIVLSDDGRYTAESVIPYYNGEQMPRYEITGLAVELGSGPFAALKVSFDCFTMHVEYTGLLFENGYRI
ncbi:MAG: hypothetical protein K2I43_07955 [Alistipes sp.]|nr:hypothetical protein [Alistipes sp.]